MALAALAGAAATGGPALADTQPAALQAKLERQIADAERSAVKAPRDAQARARLGQMYMSAGRFGSAASSFEQAVSMGDTSPAVGLGLTLAYVATARKMEARTLLARYRQSIPAGDYALALALAGQPADAVTMLSAVIGQGGSTAKIRQNLAYAYALDGRWHEARIVASQDVPADQLDARMEQWAGQASSGSESGIGGDRSRVAALLGAPLTDDAGLPTSLVLGEPHALKSLAANGAISSPTKSATGSEPRPEAIAPVPMVAVAGTPVVVRRFTAEPIVAPVPTARPELPVIAPKGNSPVRERVAGAGGHAMQLGAFTLLRNARRAKDNHLRNPAFAGRDIQITKAIVNDRQFWRVTVSGLDADAAVTACSDARRHGRDCIAFARPASLAMRGATGDQPRR